MDLAIEVTGLRKTYDKTEALRGVLLICPQRENRTKPPLQDGRTLSLIRPFQGTGEGGDLVKTGEDRVHGARVAAEMDGDDRAGAGGGSHRPGSG